MKLRTSTIPIFSIVMLLILFAPLAKAGYDQRLGAHISHHEWARFYAETAMRQVREGRSAHCDFRGGHWEPYYNIHYNWAISNSNHKGWVVIDRRNAALAKCRSRHGGYYGYQGRSHHYVKPDYRNFWRSFNRGRPQYGTRGRGHSFGHQGYRNDRNDGRYDRRDNRGDSRNDRHDNRRGDRSGDRGNNRGDNRGDERGRDRDRDRRGGGG